MNFDYTYINFFGHPLFEPMIMLTNLITFAFSVFCFMSLRKYKNSYAVQMSRFILLLGTSSIIGAVAHAVHYQLGDVFFESVFFLMNATSFFSIYYCFRGPHTYSTNARPAAQKYIYLVRVWVVLLLIFCQIKGDFLLVKINAALVLIYSLVVHYRAYKTKAQRGNGLIVAGLLISFLPIIVHTLKFSLHAYFNYKDVSHVIMIVSLVYLYRGIKLNAEDLDLSPLTKD